MSTNSNTSADNTNSNTNDNNDIDLSSLPPCRIFVRTKTSCEIYTIPEPYTTGNNKIILSTGSTTFQHLSSNGQYVYLHKTNHGVIRYDLSLESSLSTLLTTQLPEPYFLNSINVQHMILSSKSNYAVTWEKYHENTCPLNLKVWDCNTGQCVISFLQKSFIRDSWPYIQFTYDEKYMILLSSSQLRVYDTATFTSRTTDPIRFIYSLTLKGCSSFTLPQTYNEGMSLSYYLTTFIPVTKDKPASVMIYELKPQQQASEPPKEAFNLLSSKLLFQAESCHTYWSPTNDAVIITLQTSVDTTGQSYYGQSQIFLWNTKIHNNASMISVPLPQDGPISCIQWIPNPNKPLSFIIIAGKMPAMVSLHHGITGAAIYLFGNHVHRNIVHISPHGRFMILGGFGNLAGGINFWDINKKKLIPHNTNNINNTLKLNEAVIQYEWSPNSRYFITATCSPRMNLDNNIKLFHYNGIEIINTPWDNKLYKPDQLIQVSFIPSCLIPTNIYPDRPQSPLPENHNKETATTNTVTSATTIKKQLTTTTPASSSTGKYVPPSARGRMTSGSGVVGMSGSSSGGGGGTSLAERLRQEKQGSVRTAGKVGPTNGGSISALTGKVIPGLGPSATSNANTKSKSALKREKQKQKITTTPISTTNVTASTTPSVPAAKSSEAKATTISITPAAPTSTSPEDIEKRIRKIKKLLKQIDELKVKKDPLNDDQKSKLLAEQELLNELKSLEI